jgi:anti-sigma regulatory factor (Ser/Thr protein kinase)
MTVARRFPAEASSVAAARHFVRETLSDHSSDLREVSELLASELATNSVLHAQTAFEVAIRVTRREVRVEVRDSGSGRPTVRSPTAEERSGRGLRIVEAMANSWGVVPGPTGKVVWFTLPVEPSAAKQRSRSGDEDQSQQAGAKASGSWRRTSCQVRPCSA